MRAVTSYRIFPPLWLPVLLLASCGPSGGFRITPVPVDQSLEERTVQRDSGWVTHKVALIDIDGIIADEQRGGLFADGEHPVSLLVEKIRAAESDSAVKAVILRVNSPGGTVTGSHFMYDELRRFKLRTKKPVVAMFMDLAASGGYYVACAADEIIACPTTVTGSIGVIMQMLELSDTLEKIGVHAEAITSGKHKDSGSPFRRLRDDERALFQKIVDGMYEQFLDVVAAGRPKLGKARIRELADGRVYLAPQALDAGLIDRIGNISDAFAAAKVRAGIKTARLVRYDRPLGWKPTAYAGSPMSVPGATYNILNIQGLELFTTGPKFLYLWRPGR